MKTAITSSKKTQKILKNKAIFANFAVLFLFSFSFAYASAPTPTTHPVTITSATNVTLNGFINTGGLKTSYWFELYENGSSAGSFGNGNINSSGDVHVSIVQLDPQKSYTVRLAVQNADSNGPAYGESIGFSTASDSSSASNSGTAYYGNTTPNYTANNVPNYFVNNTGNTAFGRTPIVSTAYATNVTDTGVTFNGYVDPNGGSNVYRWFEWGTTQSLGNISGNLSAGTNPNYFSHGVSGLDRNTIYYFRAGAHSSAGTVYGSIFSFTTGSSINTTSNIAPVLIVKTPSYITSESTQLNATIVKGGSSLKSGYFEWGTSQTLGNTTPTQTLLEAPSTNIIEVLSNLKPNTSYVYRVVVQDATNAVYRSQIATLYTAAATGGGVPASSLGGSAVTKSIAVGSGVAAPIKQPETKTDTIAKDTSGAAGAFFASTSIALIGWFLSVILLMIVIIMGVMLKKNGKKNNIEQTTEGFKEFPDLPGHPISNSK